jgi:hypothetical protein
MFVQRTRQKKKENTMKNNNLIIAGLVIVVLLLAGVVYQQSHQKTPGQEIADGVGHAVENVGNSIQDAAH